MASGTETRQRNVTVTVRMTAEERNRLETLSAKSGLAAGAFMRAASLNDPGLRSRRRPPADHVALRKLLGELGRVGNNINQIARALNTGEEIEPAELREAMTAYLELRDAIFIALNMDPADDHQGRQPKRS